MQKFSLNLKPVFTFRKWTNAGYGIFRSLGKLIRIAVLVPVYLMFWQSAEAQTDTLNVDEIQIESTRTQTELLQLGKIIHVISREEIENLPVTSVSDLLDFTASIDIRQRGAHDVQADVSMRGSSFEQVLILLNGVKLNDVQTGHHNMNLPVSFESIERIEILEGPGIREFGANAYTGAINFITNEGTANQLKINTLSGQNGLFQAGASVNFGIGKMRNHLSGDYSQSDGYLFKNDVNNTDFQKFSIFWHGALKFKASKLQFQAGYIDKGFGANGFYSPKYPWQYEQIKTTFGNLKFSTNTKHPFQISFSFRDNQDRFELFREDRYVRDGNYFVYNSVDTAVFSKGVYQAWNYYKGHNYHFTTTSETEIKQNFNTKFGKTSVGAALRYEHILSNVLGEAADTVAVPGEPYGQFTKAKERVHYNIFGEHVYQINKFQISAGANANFNDDFNWNFSGGADILYRISKNISTYISANQAFRLPTFTDLYYVGPTNLSNPDLKPETAITYEIGTKYRNSNIYAHLAVFQRIGQNTIDWGRLSDTEKWQSMNLTELITKGAEFSVQKKFEKNAFVRTISGAYSYTTTNKVENNYQSMYALDYLKHKAVFGFSHKIWRNFGASWTVKYESRNGTYSRYIDSEIQTFDYKPFTTADVSVFWKNSMVEIYAKANNFTDTQYFEIGGVQMPGRWILGGVKLKLSKL